MPNLPIEDLIHAGRSKRYHTEVIAGQTIAEHSWYVTMLCMMLHPNPSLKLLKAALVHDLAEHRTADVPAPVKWARPELGDMIRQLEEDQLKAWDLHQELCEEDQRFLKAVDLLECIVYGSVEIRLGNTFAADMVVRAVNYLKANGTFERFPEMRRCVKNVVQSVEQAGFQLRGMNAL